MTEQTDTSLLDFDNFDPFAPANVPPTIEENHSQIGAFNSDPFANDDWQSALNGITTNNKNNNNVIFNNNNNQQNNNITTTTTTIITKKDNIDRAENSSLNTNDALNNGTKTSLVTMSVNSTKNIKPTTTNLKTTTINKDGLREGDANGGGNDEEEFEEYETVVYDGGKADNGKFSNTSTSILKKSTHQSSSIQPASSPSSSMVSSQSTQSTVRDNSNLMESMDDDWMKDVQKINFKHNNNNKNMNNNNTTDYNDNKGNNINNNRSFKSENMDFIQSETSVMRTEQNKDSSDIIITSGSVNNAGKNNEDDDEEFEEYEFNEDITTGVSKFSVHGSANNNNNIVIKTTQQQSTTNTSNNTYDSNNSNNQSNYNNSKNTTSCIETENFDKMDFVEENRSSKKGLAGLKNMSIEVEEEYGNQQKHNQQHQQQSDKTQADRTNALIHNYGSSSDNLCTKCGKRAYEMEKVTVDMVPYHKSCFRCFICHKLLNLGNYSTAEGNFYCKADFQKHFQLKGSHNFAPDVSITKNDLIKQDSYNSDGTHRSDVYDTEGSQLQRQPDVVVSSNVYVLEEELPPPSLTRNLKAMFEQPNQQPSQPSKPQRKNKPQQDKSRDAYQQVQNRQEPQQQQQRGYSPQTTRDLSPEEGRRNSRQSVSSNRNHPQQNYHQADNNQRYSNNNQQYNDNKMNQYNNTNQQYNNNNNHQYNNNQKQQDYDDQYNDQQVNNTQQHFIEELPQSGITKNLVAKWRDIEDEKSQRSRGREVSRSNKTSRRSQSSSRIEMSNRMVAVGDGGGYVDGKRSRDNEDRIDGRMNRRDMNNDDEEDESENDMRYRGRGRKRSVDENVRGGGTRSGRSGGGGRSVDQRGGGRHEDDGGRNIGGRNGGGGGRNGGGRHNNEDRSRREYNDDYEDDYDGRRNEGRRTSRDGNQGSRGNNRSDENVVMRSGRGNNRGDGGRSKSQVYTDRDYVDQADDHATKARTFKWQVKEAKPLNRPCIVHGDTPRYEEVTGEVINEQTRISQLTREANARRGRERGTDGGGGDYSSGCREDGGSDRGDRSDYGSDRGGSERGGSDRGGSDIVKGSYVTEIREEELPDATAVKDAMRRFRTMEDSSKKAPTPSATNPSLASRDQRYDPHLGPSQAFSSHVIQSGKRREDEDYEDGYDNDDDIPTEGTTRSMRSKFQNS